MLIEVCDLCGNQVSSTNKTEIIIKDNKGLHVDEYGHPWPCKRRFKGVICDDCLQFLKEKNHARKDRSLYDSLTAVLNTLYSPDTYIVIHGIYDPEDDGGDHEGMYHAAVDIFEEGLTHHVWFTINDDDSIKIEETERWFIG